ncbi:hypothetical protein [Acinetobacter indicus]|uniref:hypothetical protein n=1 Tax=Acinetobacter indicus TaxID=756892 RepID=UPI00209727A7|nr:hypothetical protein [Acinetobacter indicus]MCO8108594.1 hypothetical protein [Acinetobacter indicus]
MIHYHKTQLGIDALQQRQLQLNARQRRLLVLIGTEDFEQLGDQFKQRIATPELIEQLLEMGLISSAATEPAEAEILVPAQAEPQSEAVSTLRSEIKTTLNTPVPKLVEKWVEHIIAPSSAAKVAEAEPAAIAPEIPVLEIEVPPEVEPEPLVALRFEDTKQLMASLLQRYCGLMAKQLILRIQAAPDIRSLKLCQMQWITELQESRLPPKELNHALQQINFSLQSLQSA